MKVRVSLLVCTTTVMLNAGPALPHAPQGAGPAVFGPECWADAAPVACARRTWLARFLAVKEPELTAPAGGVSLRLAYEDGAACSSDAPKVTVVRVQAAPGKPGSLIVTRCGTKRTTVLPAAGADRLFTLYRDAPLQDVGASANLSPGDCPERVLEVTDGERQRAVYFNCSPPAGLDTLVSWLQQRGPRQPAGMGLARGARPAVRALPRSL